MKRPRVAGLEIRRGILQHIESFWPTATIVEERWEEGSVEENIPGFRVLQVNSRAPRRPVIYLTSGCFLVGRVQHVRHEFFIISPKEQRQHVETLAMLANFHADHRYRLDVGSVVNIGDPWMPGSICDHLLISVPYPYGPKLEWLKTPDICVRFLWAMPITPREAAFLELNSLEALEQQFDAAKVDYMDPVRSSIV